MKRVLHYQITEQDAGMSVADFLRSRGFSRHLLTELRRSGDGVLLNDRPVFLSALLSFMDCLKVCLPPEEPSGHIVPVPLPLSIVYEDEDLLIVNKPCDMPVHPSIGNYENTLANALAWYHQKNGLPFVFRCINRLDRDTSGLLIVARNALSASALSDQMRQRNIHRTYLAVVKGIAPSFGTIDVPIARASDSLIERCVDEKNGEAAVTHYERLALSCNHAYSLLKITLETGRTHQIRVHLKSIGHPLPGDYLYCPDYTDYTRQPLHSWQLSFLHPVTRQPLCFSSALPSDFHPEFFPDFHGKDSSSSEQV